MCHMSDVTCHLLLTPTATATDPPPANSPTMHSRLVHQDKKVCFWEPSLLPKNKFSLNRPLGTLSFTESAARDS